MEPHKRSANVGSHLVGYAEPSLKGCPLTLHVVTRGPFERSWKGLAGVKLAALRYTASRGFLLLAATAFTLVDEQHDRDSSCPC